jgi:prepilin-type N-terminal cleavage/methylation domain-containing protein
METRSQVSGFTLVEILVALSILSIVMTILYSTFSTSSATARLLEQRADELASLAGAIDTLSPEVRGAYERFSGRKTAMIFTTMSPFREDNAPVVQTVSYEFAEGRLLRKSFEALDVAATPGFDAKVKRTLMLLEEVADGSFSFFDGTKWIDEWTTPAKLPAGVKVSFSYRRTSVETVIPVWSGR